MILFVGIFPHYLNCLMNLLMFYQHIDKLIYKHIDYLMVYRQLKQTEELPFYNQKQILLMVFDHLQMGKMSSLKRKL